MRDRGREGEKEERQREREAKFLFPLLSKLGSHTAIVCSLRQSQSPIPVQGNKK